MTIDFWVRNDKPQNQLRSLERHQMHLVAERAFDNRPPQKGVRGFFTSLNRRAVGGGSVAASAGEWREFWAQISPLDPSPEPAVWDMSPDDHPKTLAVSLLPTSTAQQRRAFSIWSAEGISWFASSGGTERKNVKRSTSKTKTFTVKHVAGTSL